MRLSPHPVIDSVISHLQLEQRIGGYEAASQAEKEVANFYTQLAQLLNCESSEIAFMESATRAWQSALLSLDLKAGDEIITAGNEYVGNYLSLLALARHRGIRLRRLPLALTVSSRLKSSKTVKHKNTGYRSHPHCQPAGRYPRHQGNR